MACNVIFSENALYITLYMYMSGLSWMVCIQKVTPRCEDIKGFRWGLTLITVDEDNQSQKAWVVGFELGKGLAQSDLFRLKVPYTN